MPEWSASPGKALKKSSIPCRKWENHQLMIIKYPTVSLLQSHMQLISLINILLIPQYVDDSKTCRIEKYISFEVSVLMVHFMQDGQLNKVETQLENCKKLLLFCLCHLGQLWSRILLSFESCWPIFSSCVCGNPRWIQWNKLQHKHKMKILLNWFHMEGRALTLWLLVLHVWHHLNCKMRYKISINGHHPSCMCYTIYSSI